MSWFQRVEKSPPGWRQTLQAEARNRLRLACEELGIDVEDVRNGEEGTILVVLALWRKMQDAQRGGQP
jgi:hypothetical protein